MCLSVGADLLLFQNILNYAKCGVVLAFAPKDEPGQSGRGKVNDETNDYIVGQVTGLGFYLDNMSKVGHRILKSVSRQKQKRKTSFHNFLIFRKINASDECSA